MRRRILSLAVLLLLSVASIAVAENRAETFSLTPFVGGYTFDGKQHLETGPVVGLRGGYNFTNRIGVEGLFDYTLSEGTLNDKGTNVYNYSLDMLYHFFPESRLVPFLMAGYGGMTIDQEGSKTFTKGAFNYGAGVKYALNESMELRGEVRHLIFKSDETLNNIEYGIGLGFLFGGTKPAPAPVVAPPPPPPLPQPEPKPAPVPPPANPKANLTASPTTIIQGSAATLSWTSQNATTCNIDPEIGSVPLQGTRAVTPSASITYTLTCNGPGGSATSGANVSVTAPPPPPAPEPPPEKLTMVLNIEFDTAKADIKKKYHDEIGRVAEFLKTYPTVTGVIEGHTDNVGSAEMNMKLSQRRAESVRKYLVDVYGIEPARLSAKGYGLSRPIADNKTPAGRQKNRRIQAQFETVVKKK